MTHESSGVALVAALHVDVGLRIEERGGIRFSRIEVDEAVAEHAVFAEGVRPGLRLPVVGVLAAGAVRTRQVVIRVQLATAEITIRALHRIVLHVAEVRGDIAPSIGKARARENIDRHGLAVGAIAGQRRTAGIYLRLLCI